MIPGRPLVMMVLPVAVVTVVVLPHAGRVKVTCGAGGGVGGGSGLHGVLHRLDGDLGRVVTRLTHLGVFKDNKLEYNILKYS